MNQEQMEPFLVATTVCERHNDVTRHNNAHTELLEDKNANEACKNLIIQTVDKVYLGKLLSKHFRYKGKTIRDFLDLLIEKIKQHQRKEQQ